MGRRVSNKKILLKFLVFYIAILFIPIMVGVVSYRKSVEIVEGNAKAANIAMLNQCMNIIDNRLRELDNITEQIVSNPLVARFQMVKKPYDDSNIGLTFNLVHQLPNYEFNNNFISSYYIIFKKNNYVLSHNAIYPLTMFKSSILEYKNLSGDKWNEVFLKSYNYNTYLPAQNVTYAGRHRTMLTYIKSLGNYNDVNGSVIMLVDSNEILKLLNGLNVSKDSWVYIADKSNNILLSVNSGGIGFKSIEDKDFDPEGITQLKIDDRDMLVTATSSNYNGWKYVLIQPSNIVLSQVTYIKTIISVFVLVSFVLGLVVSFILAYKNTKPVISLIDTINSKYSNEINSSVDAYGYIQDSLLKLIGDYESMDKSIKEQLPFLNNAFFESILKGQFHTNNEIELLSKYIGIEIISKHYAVAILSFNLSESEAEKQIKEVQGQKVMLREHIEGQYENNIYLFNISMTRTAFIIQLGNDSRNYENQLRDLIGRLTIDLERLLKRNFSISVGKVYDSPLDISRSYEESQQGIYWAMWKSVNGVVWYEDIVKESKSYYYPFEIENKLINEAKSGRYETINLILRDVFRENFQNRQLSTDMLQLLMFDMIGSITKIIEKFSLGDQYYNEAMYILKKKDEQTSEWFNFKINNLYSDICSNINERKRNNDASLIKKITVFIDNSYANPNLSLSFVAELFELSEVYLSQLFKEKTGENFSTYVEKQRIKSAINLLTETELHINEIAEKVGYNSSNTFCRAFKRHNQISATDYRKIQILRQE
jgi:two-component system, response regulator YesN